MKVLINFLQRYGYGMFLGGALTQVGVPWYGWQFYAVAIPVVILVEWRTCIK